MSSQARALAVVLTAVRAPGIARVLEWVTGPLVALEDEVDGVPVSVYSLARARSRPPIVFLNGVTARGRHHPDVRRLAEALARAGFLVAVPDLPGVSVGKLDGRTLDSAVSIARWVADGPDAAGGCVGLLGVSVGATLALLVAENPQLAARVTVVAGIAPLPDFVNVARLATTGFEWSSFMGLVAARSLIAALPASASRQKLLDELDRIPDDADDPLAGFRSADRKDDAETRTVVALLGNRDPERFDELYERLPAELRAGITLLSPLVGAADLRAPVEIAVAEADTYVPFSELEALAEAATGTSARLTVTPALNHADPRLRLGELRGFLAFYGWAVRTIKAARR